jgi:long-chain acyl-CoA synthetase
MLITTRRSAAACQQVLQSYESPCLLFFVEDREKTTKSDSGNVLNAAFNPDTPVMYQFSSGSTGRAKRIARTHRNLLFELNSLAWTLALTHEDRFLGVTPFSHVNGLMRSMMANLRAGETLYPVARFERQAIAEIIEKHRISVFIGVPFMFGVMAKANYSRRPDFLPCGFVYLQALLCHRNSIVSSARNSEYTCVSSTAQPRLVR